MVKDPLQANLPVGEFYGLYGFPSRQVKSFARPFVMPTQLPSWWLWRMCYNIHMAGWNIIAAKLGDSEHLKLSRFMIQLRSCN